MPQFCQLTSTPMSFIYYIYATFTQFNSVLVGIGAGCSCNIVAYLIHSFVLTLYFVNRKRNRTRQTSVHGTSTTRCIMPPADCTMYLLLKTNGTNLIQTQFTLQARQHPREVTAHSLLMQINIINIICIQSTVGYIH